MHARCRPRGERTRHQATQPTVFVAFTLHVTAVPLVKPLTAIGEVVPVFDWLPQVAV